jgi:betaine lipid synthase
MAITTTLIDMYGFDSVLLVAAFSTAILLGFAWVLITNQEKCRNIGKFMWNCFMKPISGSESGWGGQLESFYAGQADVYDATRKGLLKGRITMMKLAAAHLRSGITPHEKGNLVWVDVRTFSQLC